jgi:hypothetical protein
MLRLYVWWIIIIENIKGVIYISNITGTNGSYSLDSPCGSIADILINFNTEEKIVIKDSFSSDENLMIEKNFNFSGGENDMKVFELKTTFCFKVFSKVYFENIKFVIDSNHNKPISKDDHQIFSSVENGHLSFEYCDMIATDTNNKIAVRLFTITSKLLMKNVKIKDMNFNLGGIEGGQDFESPIYISGDGYLEGVTFSNFSKISNYDFILHRHNGSDYHECIFENISHPGTIVSFWFTRIFFYII